MKTKILSLVSAVGLIFGLSACQDPHEFSPTKYDEHFDSMTASFFDDDRDENAFPAEFDYQNHVITIVVPWTYPANTESYLEMADLTRMKVQCNLKKGLVLEPALTTIDLTKDTHITITDGYGIKTPYTIRGEVRKSNNVDIFEFSIPEAGVPAIVDADNHVITLLALEEIGTQLAQLEAAHHATLNPDPRVTPIDWDNDPTLEVTAEDGHTKATYTFTKGTPEKLMFGLREHSAKLAWVKKQSELGIPVYTTAELESGDTRFNGSGGLGVIGDNLILNESGANKAYVLNKKNGTLISTIDLSALGKNSTGFGNNHRMCGDNHGNLLFAVSPVFTGSLQLWKMSGIDGQLVKLLDYANSAAVGNSISVAGDLNGDAIITSGTNGALQFYRWIVKGGQLQSATPDVIVPGGYAAGSCWGNMDIIYTNGSNPNSNYFTIGYMAHNPLPPTADDTKAINRTCQYLNGATNDVISQGTCITSNSVENSGDYIEFNNSKYFIHNVMNTLGYGYGASLLMYDVTARNLETPALDFNGGDLAFTGQYGAAAANGTHDKAANGSDVMFSASEDGYFLYIFFEFRNGYVGCVRCDCIDMNK